MIVTAAAIGSNLPDLDLLYAFVGGKVNYLLHHRGHTHTIVGALLLAALFFLAGRAWLRRRGQVPSSSDLWWLGAVLACSALLHITMDATNSYGVHPLWPLYDGWLYGDAVFIAEPLLWAACGPLVFLLRTPVARVLVALLLATGTALAFFSGLLPPGVMAAYFVILTGMLALGRWATPRRALLASLLLWIGATVTFIGASAIAGRRVDAAAAMHFPEARLLDRVLTPMPSNPLCWEALLVQEEHGGIALRRAMLALAPTWISAAGCSSRNLDEPVTAPLAPVHIPASDGLYWYGEVVTPADRLVRAVAEHCVAAAAMRFIRAPWLANVQGRTVLGDLRYDREQALGFAELELQEAPGCPFLVPPWLPPRGDALTGPDRGASTGSLARRRAPPPR